MQLFNLLEQSNQIVSVCLSPRAAVGPSPRLHQWSQEEGESISSILIFISYEQLKSYFSMNL
jgi:hypothetical protein